MLTKEAIQLEGTLEGNGPNKIRAKGSVRELGHSAMTDNASTAVVYPSGTTGKAEPLEGDIDPKGLTDTYMTEMPEGTAGLSGPYG